MLRKPGYAKIAISIPREDLAAADTIARERDRSRSWIIAEAVRKYVAQAAPAAHRPGLGRLRHAQLVADLKLTPEERVFAADETARAAPARGVAGANRVIGFDRYDDYLEWKRVGDRGA